MIKKSGFSSIDEYISSQPAERRNILIEIRKLINQAVPGMEQKISYQMPTFYLHENIVHFALSKDHLGFYPTPSAIVKFSKELNSYKTSKGAVRLPLDKPLPVKLITEIVRFRAEEAVKNAGEKRKSKSQSGG